MCNGGVGQEPQRAQRSRETGADIGGCGADHSSELILESLADAKRPQGAMRPLCRKSGDFSVRSPGVLLGARKVMWEGWLW